MSASQPRPFYVRTKYRKPVAFDYKTDNAHSVKHRAQFCLVSMSVIVSLIGATTLWVTDNDVLRLLSLSAVVLSIPLFTTSHVIAAHVASAIVDRPSQQKPHSLNPLREKLASALHRRDLKQLRKCLPYRYGEN